MLIKGLQGLAKGKKGPLPQLLITSGLSFLGFVQAFDVSVGPNICRIWLQSKEWANEFHNTCGRFYNLLPSMTCSLY